MWAFSAQHCWDLCALFWNHSSAFPLFSLGHFERRAAMSQEDMWVSYEILSCLGRVMWLRIKGGQAAMKVLLAEYWSPLQTLGTLNSGGLWEDRLASNCACCCTYSPCTHGPICKPALPINIGFFCYVCLVGHCAPRILHAEGKALEVLVFQAQQDQNATYVCVICMYLQ